ncbi:MAG: two-component sensor histidine kinase [Planctomycetaceae bacterium TMED10]|nr:MAG: two-component sensor histidine kinase [Planctomycetaceae bacterium TMED10]
MADKQPIELSESEQLRLLKEQLARAQRMTALGELLGTTTHEYNNVLMTVLNYAKMGIRHKDEATRDKAFEKILAAGERAAKITNSILGLARNRSGDFEPTDLAKLVDDALVLLERELRKYRIAIETHLEDAPPARANPNQIQQILLNLLINARQAMPNGGQVVIRVGLDQASRMVELSVRDNGPGIAEDKLPRIFDPYYSTKKGPDETGKGGTGVGLSACRDIMEAHQGKILVASTVGKGTAFTLRLPVAQNVVVAGTPTVPLGMPSASPTSRTDRQTTG